MIASVIIAPVERWCEAAKEDAKTKPDLAALPGKTIRIYTESMRSYSDPNGHLRDWRVFEEDLEWFREVTGFYYVDRVCEHLLEID